MFNLIQNFLSDLLQRTVIKVSLIEINVIKNYLIRAFMKNYQIEMDDYPRKSHLDYRHFNDFFTREINPIKRPIEGDDNGLISPVDGKIVEFGKIEEGRLFQIKGMHYELYGLLDGNETLAQNYENGSYISIYLAPYNYHRVHAPIKGDLKMANMVPGEMHRVDQNALSNIENLYIKNQRLITEFNDSLSDCIMIMVAARNVASMTHKEINQNYEKGDEIGHFNLGSTVVVLLPNDVQAEWSHRVSIEKDVKMGEKIAQLSKIK